MSGTRKGTHPHHGGARKGGKDRRKPVAAQAEETAVRMGVALRPRGRRRPLRTEQGGATKTRATRRTTRKQLATKVSTYKGKGLGKGRKRVGPIAARPT